MSRSLILQAWSTVPEERAGSLVGLQHAAQVEVEVADATGPVDLLQPLEELRLLPEQLGVDLAPVVHARQVKVGPAQCSGQLKGRSKLAPVKGGPA
jgi:hypothetical protein